CLSLHDALPISLRAFCKFLVGRDWLPIEKYHSACSFITGVAGIGGRPQSSRQCALSQSRLQGRSELLFLLVQRTRDEARPGYVSNAADVKPAQNQRGQQQGDGGQEIDWGVGQGLLL